MNKVILKYKTGDTKEVKTKLSDHKKIIAFLKIIGEWSSDIIEVKLVEGIVSVSCSYQNIDIDNMQEHTVN